MSSSSNHVLQVSRSAFLRFDGKKFSVVIVSWTQYNQKTYCWKIKFPCKNEPMFSRNGESKLSSEKPVLDNGMELQRNIDKLTEILPYINKSIHMTRGLHGGITKAAYIIKQWDEDNDAVPLQIGPTCIMKLERFLVGNFVRGPSDSHRLKTNAITVYLNEMIRKI